MMAKILVVDDDLSNADVIQLILEEQNHVVISVQNSDLVRDAVLSFTPDLIVMDILLDKCDGRQLCDAIKTNPKTMQIPILLITAMLESQALKMKCMADKVMFKPFEYTFLVRQVTALIKSATYPHVG